MVVQLFQSPQDKMPIPCQALVLTQPLSPAWFLGFLNANFLPLKDLGSLRILLHLLGNTPTPVPMAVAMSFCTPLAKSLLNSSVWPGLEEQTVVGLFSKYEL